VKTLTLKRLLLAAGLLVASGQALAQATPEYRAKAGFLYNFIAFTEWPGRVGSPLNLCVYGADPFGDELNALQGKSVNGRNLAIRSVGNPDQVKGCQVVFVASSAIDSLPRILDALQGEPVLTVADSAGALDSGVGINMRVRQSKIAFEVNLVATRRAQLNVSSKLLRLASEVRQ
jgi:YfiR/HmsC-like